MLLGDLPCCIGDAFDVVNIAFLFAAHPDTLFSQQANMHMCIHTQRIHPLPPSSPPHIPLTQTEINSGSSPFIIRINTSNSSPSLQHQLAPTAFYKLKPPTSQVFLFFFSWIFKRILES